MVHGARKLKRTAAMVAVLSKYGFGEVFERSGLKKLIPGRKKDAAGAKVHSLTVYERIRLALEELGPAYIKLGQMFSNREDLLPAPLITELRKLQDEVPPEEMDVWKKLEEELSLDPSAHFNSIVSVPVAAASIAQVYRARLMNGRHVVLKVKRSDIQEVIESDLLIMKDLLMLLEAYSEEIKSLKLLNVLEAFEGAIHNELSLLGELTSIERFARNFSGVPGIVVPQTYRQYSNNNVLCMDFIDGIKVSNLQALRAQGFDPPSIARQGFSLYMKQILDHGFFHADPHPGNILVTPGGEIAFIDFGTMAALMPADKENLENLILCLIRKEPKKFISVVKRIALDYSVKNETRLERDIYGLIDMADASSLNDIDISTVIIKLRKIFSENSITLPEHYYLLMKGLVQLEGTGRLLDPDIHVFEILKPYTKRILKERYSFRRLFRRNVFRAENFAQSLTELPGDIHNLIRRIESNDLRITHELIGLTELRESLRKGINRLVLALIISALSIGSSILVSARMPPLIYGIPLLGYIGFLISAILGLSIVFSMWRDR